MMMMMKEKKKEKKGGPTEPERSLLEHMDAVCASSSSADQVGGEVKAVTAAVLHVLSPEATVTREQAEEDAMLRCVAPVCLWPGEVSAVDEMLMALGVEAANLARGGDHVGALTLVRDRLSDARRVVKQECERQWHETATLVERVDVLTKVALKGLAEEIDAAEDACSRSEQDEAGVKGEEKQYAPIIAGKPTKLELSLPRLMRKFVRTKQSKATREDLSSFLRDERKEAKQKRKVELKGTKMEPRNIKAVLQRAAKK